MGLVKKSAALSSVRTNGTLISKASTNGRLDVGRTGVRYAKRPVDAREVQYTDLGLLYCFSLKARAAELSLSDASKSKVDYPQIPKRIVRFSARTTLTLAVRIPALRLPIDAQEPAIAVCFSDIAHSSMPSASHCFFVMERRPRQTCPWSWRAA